MLFIILFFLPTSAFWAVFLIAHGVVPVLSILTGLCLGALCTAFAALAAATIR